MKQESRRRKYLKTHQKVAYGSGDMGSTLCTHLLYPSSLYI